MSYAAFGALNPRCMELQADYGQGVYLPIKVCPAPTGKTGDSPPRPAWCDYATVGVKQAMKLAGLYSGPIDPNPTPATLDAMMAIARRNNVAWNGDPWTVSPELCSAIIRETSAKAPHCAGRADRVGCITPPTDTSLPPSSPPSSPGSPPPPAGPPRTLMATKYPDIPYVHPGTPSTQQTVSENSSSSQSGGSSKTGIGLLLAGAVVLGAIGYFMMKDPTTGYRPNRSCGMRTKTGGKFGRCSAPKRYRKKGARRAADYAYPSGFQYPLVFRTSSGKVKTETTRRHIASAARYFARHKHRYTQAVRRTIAKKINAAKRRYGVGGHRVSA